MKITVFTPTYNRAYCLPKAYESLKRQTFKNFQWVIMDDGSTDNTRDLIKQWKQENVVDIVYEYQPNQGRFAAFNNAQKYFDGELVAPLDSDDYFLDNCIQRITEVWEGLGDKRKELSGILAYMETTGGGILGKPFPKGIEMGRLYDMVNKGYLVGDKFEVCRADLLKKHRYPVFKGEKFTGDHMVYYWVNEEYPEYLLRGKLCHREYFGDGLTVNRLKNHILSPNGMREHYLCEIEYGGNNISGKIKHYIGYIAFVLLSKDSLTRAFKRAPSALWMILMFIPGIAYYCYLLYKKKELGL